MRLPEDLQARVQRELNVENFLSLKESTALLRVRKLELLSKADELADLPSLKEMLAEVETARDKIEAGETVESDVLDDVAIMLRSLIENQTVWHEIQKLTDSERKLVQSERDALLKAGQVISVQQAVHAMNLLVGCVAEFVQDPRVIDRIQRQYSVIMGIHKGAIEHEKSAADNDGQA